jgi:hypothetical protein
MTLPQTNATCDIYHSGNAPPAAPDIAAVSFYLYEDVRAGAESTEGGFAAFWSHIGLFDLAVDIRHDGAILWTAGDTVCVPDQNGSRFAVLAVVRVARGLSQDHKKAFLRLSNWTWPTSEL